MGHPVSDDQLATEGMQLRNQGRVLLIACGALARLLKGFKPDETCRILQEAPCDKAPPKARYSQP